MVANHWPRALLILAPGGIVALAKLLAGALRVGAVTEIEDGSPYFAQKPCCFAVLLEVASGYVSCSDQRHRLGLAAARLGRQHDRRHGCQQHGRGHRTDNKNSLAYPRHPPLCGVEEKSENPRPVM